MEGAVYTWKASEDEQAGTSPQQHQVVSEMTATCLTYPIVLARDMQLRTEKADGATITQDSGIAASFYHHAMQVLQTWYGVIQEILYIPLQQSAPQVIHCQCTGVS